MLPPGPVSSYLTFSPLSRRKHDGYFLLHYYTLAGIFLLGSMALFVARLAADFPFEGSSRCSLPT
jgi:hypothetical protein